MAIVRFNVKDNSNENSSVKINVDDAISDGDITTLVVAFEGVMLGTRGNATLDTAEAKDAGSQALPASQFAQRETKWLVGYTDDVTGVAYRKELPTADLGEIVAGSQLMDISQGNGLAFKNAWDASVLSPDENPTTLQSAKHVGRNL